MKFVYNGNFLTFRKRTFSQLDEVLQQHQIRVDDWIGELRLLIVNLKWDKLSW